MPELWFLLSILTMVAGLACLIAAAPLRNARAWLILAGVILTFGGFQALQSVLATSGL